MRNGRWTKGMDYGEGSATARKAEADDLPVKNVADASKDADLIMMCAPDELQADIWKDHIEANIKDGAAIAESRTR